MLDVITDFWKPVKKATSLEKPDLNSLQVGSHVGFGTVPQSNISGKRFRVSSVNTYQFGEEKMTSFVLTSERDDSVSLIVASSDGEQYLAISRRVAFSERMRMFDPAELEAVVEQPDAVKLTCREIDANWKHWVVSTYKKEISGLRGSVVKGDFRSQPVPGNALNQPFDYMLLTSDNNEYAIEVERYADGRIELYATVYRRVSDVVELENPQNGETRPVAPPALEVVKTETPAFETKPPEPRKEPEIVKEEEKPAPAPEAKKPVEAAPPPKPQKPAEEDMPARTSFPALSATTTTSMENRPMQPTQTSNGAAGKESVLKPNFGGERKDIKAVPNRNVELENDSVECDLRVANKIIEEAIRNEMRLSDVVRRIIALPVANPESVQIPITLTDSDFQLLAIRYGVPAADRHAIRNRIIEEINDFSGGAKA